MSVVEQTLREDPDGIYGGMDFATRDRYRHATERIAKKGRLTEGEVARKAVELARAGAAVAAGTRARARRLLPDRQGPAGTRSGRRTFAWPRPRRCAAAAGQSPLLLYLGGIALITVDRRRRPGRAGAGRRTACGAVRLGPAADRPARAAGRQPVGRGAGELAGHPAGDAASAAQDGFLHGHPAELAHAGGGADHAHQRRRHRGSGRGAGGAGFWPIATSTCTSAC